MARSSRDILILSAIIQGGGGGKSLEVDELVARTAFQILLFLVASFCSPLKLLHLLIRAAPETVLSLITIVKLVCRTPKVGH